MATRWGVLLSRLDWRMRLLHSSPRLFPSSRMVRNVPPARTVQWHCRCCGPRQQQQEAAAVAAAAYSGAQVITQQHCHVLGAWLLGYATCCGAAAALVHRAHLDELKANLLHHYAAVGRSGLSLVSAVLPGVAAAVDVPAVSAGCLAWRPRLACCWCPCPWFTLLVCACSARVATAPECPTAAHHSLTACGVLCRGHVQGGRLPVRHQVPVQRLQDPLLPQACHSGCCSSSCSF
jgi:hypothetical protein